MRPKTLATAAAVALALVLPTAGVASARSWQSLSCPSEAVQTTAVKKAVKAKKAAKALGKTKHAKKEHTRFNYGGKFCSFDGTTLVMVVWGGHDKDARRQVKSVNVPASAVVSAHDEPVAASALVNLKLGSHIRVKGNVLKVTAADGTSATTLEATQVMASGKIAAPAPDPVPAPEPAPADPAPAPTS